MNTTAPAPLWHTMAILVGRLVFGALFAMAASFKFMSMEGTAGYIAAAGFPFPLFLAWCAALFETALTICLLTGAFFTEAALLAAIYVVFLGFSFHGPSHWGADQIGQMEFGAFISHFPFAAGLLFAAVKGPGQVLAIRRGIIARA
jgi:Predicted membrane protein